MGKDLRFQILVRRRGEPFYTSDKFATEDYDNLEELKDAVSHFIDREVEQEEEWDYRNGEDEI